MHDRRQLLLLTLCTLFIGFFVTVDLVGVKLFTFSLFGIGPQHLGLGNDAQFVATAGILAFPLIFILTDLINEYYGPRMVRVFTILAVALTVLLQFVVQAAAAVPTIQFNALPPLLAQAASATSAATPVAVGVHAISHEAYHMVFAASLAVVIGSLTAFLIGQLLDVWVFSALRRATKGKALWLRAQGSTVVSQLVDTFVVIFVAFVFIPLLIGTQPWPASAAMSVSITNYVYKFAIAVAMTPLLYAVHLAMDAWLGQEQAKRMIAEAHPGVG